MRAVIYTRISRDREGAEIGVKNQEAASRALAKDMGAEVLKVYTDNDAGASRRSRKPRPGFEQMLRDAEAGKFDLVVAYSMSRLTRRPREWVDLIDLAEKTKLIFRFKVSPSFDLATADGRASALTVAVWDAAEAERTGERIQFQRQSALAEGRDIRGVRPFGYEPGAKMLRAEEAEALQWAYGAVLDGTSLVAIAREFTQRGLKRARAEDHSWRPQTIRTMLLRERNRGHLVVKGVLYGTDLLPLIDNDTFEAVKAVLTDPARQPRRGREPIRQYFTGLVRCGVCGNYLRLASSRGVTYLKCAKDGQPVHTLKVNHPTAKLEILEAEVEKNLLSILTALAALNTDFTTTAPTKDIQLELAELRRQRDLAQEMIFDKGANVPVLRAKIAKLGVEIDRLQVQFDQAVSANVGGVALDAAWEHVRHSHVTGDSWSGYWRSLDIESQRSLVRALMPNARLRTIAQANEANKAGRRGERIAYDQHPAIAAASVEALATGYALKWAEGGKLINGFNSGEQSHN
ncbi:recombinase family protein [Microbacterium aerolatum]|uniref:recombinase family protein n=1 Tax=Microbacterium aerolatum TaxID=153731 RepID=UPI00384E6C9F